MSIYFFIDSSQLPPPEMIADTIFEKVLLYMNLLPSNTVIQTLCGGYTVSYIFWVLVVVFPQKERAKKLASLTEKRWMDFRHEVIVICLIALEIGTNRDEWLNKQVAYFGCPIEKSKNFGNNVFDEIKNDRASLKALFSSTIEGNIVETLLNNTLRKSENSYLHKNLLYSFDKIKCYLELQLKSSLFVGSDVDSIFEAYMLVSKISESESIFLDIGSSMLGGYAYKPEFLALLYGESKMANVSYIDPISNKDT